MLSLNEYLNDLYVREMRRDAERIRQKRRPDYDKHETKRARRLLSDLLHLS